jgi:hypothetical protein
MSMVQVWYAKGGVQPGDQAGHRTGRGRLLPEDAEHQDREEARRRQPEGQRHHLRHESGRVDAQVAGDDDGGCHGDPADQGLPALVGHRVDLLEVDLVGDRRADDEQPPGRGGQVGRQATGGHQPDDRRRQPGDLRRGQDDDVQVSNHCGVSPIAVPGICSSTLSLLKAPIAGAVV